MVSDWYGPSVVTVLAPPVRPFVKTTNICEKYGRNANTLSKPVQNCTDEAMCVRERAHALMQSLADSQRQNETHLRAERNYGSLMTSPSATGYQKRWSRRG